MKKIRQNKKSGKEQKPNGSTLTAKVVTLKAAGEAIVTHQEVPPSPPEGKKIHPRRPLPPVPNAEEDKTDKNE